MLRLPYNPRDLAQARDLIARRGLDVLVIADDGIDPFIYTLLQSRLAPVQV